VPALLDVNNPSLTGGVQNQPDFQAGAADHRTHFAVDVPRFVRQAMAEYTELTGREYSPVKTFMCDDAETVMVGLGSVTDDVEAVVTYLRGQGKKVGCVAIKLLQPFPEAELVAALNGKKAVTVLERSTTALTRLVTQACSRGAENAPAKRHAGIPAIGCRASPPRSSVSAATILQPRHLIAASRTCRGRHGADVYLARSSSEPSTARALVQARSRPPIRNRWRSTAAKIRTCCRRRRSIRFHSVGSYSTIASGKLLVDILAGVLGMHSKSAPKYGSEKSGAPTNYYITLSPEPIKITNAELEDVEIVISPDHKVFSHTNPLKGLVAGGTFMMQTNLSAEEVWAEMPAQARKTIRDKKIRFYIVDAFAVAKKHAPTPELETR
jgi:pyruvate-ferredoxin/flavodoxin oxidoreductase